MYTDGVIIRNKRPPTVRESMRVRYIRRNEKKDQEISVLSLVENY